MPRKNSIEMKATGITLELPVVEYLDSIADEENRPRSYIINRIVKEHAQQNVHSLTKKRRQNATSQRKAG